MIPTGAREPLGIPPGPLGARLLDDGLAGLAVGATFTLAGPGRRIEVRLVEGYGFGQVYAPLDRRAVAFEPMTAPTDALRSGDGLRVLEPGEGHRATFRIDVSPAG
jgi:galactose mutarotase-like enzyme